MYTFTVAFVWCLLPFLAYSSPSSTTNSGHNSGHNSAIEYPPLNSPNNVIKLIIKTYVEQLMEDPNTDSEQLKHKIANINEYIATHPALHQRYLWVGSQAPDSFHPDEHEFERIPATNRTSARYLMRKRDAGETTKDKDKDKEQLPSEEICETHQKWEQIHETHDLYENKVKVIQKEDMKQFVFSYRCAKNKGKCLGISPLFESECTERWGWMYMYYQQEGKQPQWGFVNAPHHCACKLIPKFYQATASSSEVQRR